MCKNLPIFSNEYFPLPLLWTKYHLLRIPYNLWKWYLVVSPIDDDLVVFWVNIITGSIGRQPYVTAMASSAMNLSTPSATQSERTFPPPTGLTYTGWVYLEHVNTVPTSLHSIVGLFTVEKQFEETSSKRLINSSVFQIYLDLQTRTLVVSIWQLDL